MSPEKFTNSYSVGFPKGSSQDEKWEWYCRMIESIENVNQFHNGDDKDEFIKLLGEYDCAFFSSRGSSGLSRGKPEYIAIEFENLFIGPVIDLTDIYSS